MRFDFDGESISIDAAPLELGEYTLTAYLAIKDKDRISDVVRLTSGNEAERTTETEERITRFTAGAEGITVKNELAPTEEPVE